MANVLGTLFGNIANAIRGKTGETGTMKPADFPQKIWSIVVNDGGSKAEATEFLPTTTFTNEYGADIGAFAHFISVETATMEAWMANKKSVTVVYDGEEYNLTPQIVTGMDGNDGVCVGNLSAFGGTGNNEPFAVVPVMIDEMPCFLIGSTVDQAPTEHTIRIYQEARFTFIEGEFVATSTVQVIEHGCGEVPDIFVMYPSFVPTGGEVVVATGFSQAMYDAFGGGYLAPTSFLFKDGGSMIIKMDHGIEKTSEECDLYGAPREATRTTLKVGGTITGLRVDGLYHYFCICGIV